MASWSKPTYHRRLFLWLIACLWSMVLCFAAFQYHRERRFKAEELNIRLQMLNESLLEAIGQSDTVAHLGELPPIEGLRISVIDLRGRVIYDNSLDSLPAKNHLERTEIAEALRNGSGYTIRRHSESTGQTYFYSARRGGNRIVRTAVPYSVSLRVLLRADYGFLWFMIGVTTAMSLLGYFATRRVGLHISRLNRFAEKAECGERIFDTEPFPHDELGDISNHIVRLYAQLQQAVTDTAAVVDGAAEALTGFSAAVRSARDLLQSSGPSLDEGTRQSLSGVSAALRKAAASTGSTQSVRDALDVIDGLIDDEWTSHTGEDNNLLLMDASAPPEIQHEDGVWLVGGPWIQRLIANVNFSDYESRMWFDRMLREAGLFQRLEEMGIADGDTVSIDGFEFDYQR